MNLRLIISKLALIFICSLPAHVILAQGGGFECPVRLLDPAETDEIEVLDNGNSTITIPSYTVSDGENRLLVVFAYNNSNLFVDNITFNGQMLSRAVQNSNTGLDTNAEIWYLLLGSAFMNPVTSDVVVTFNGDAGVVSAGVASFENVNQDFPIGLTQINQGSNSNMQSFSFNSQYGNMIVDAYIERTGSVVSDDENQELFNIAPEYRMAASYELTVTGASSVASWTLNTNREHAGVAAILNAQRYCRCRLSEPCEAVDVYNNCDEFCDEFSLPNEGGEGFCDPDCLIPLPVELVYFKGKQRNNQIQLQWVTASEIQNLGFEVQRSSNGKQWKTLDFVKGFGTSLDSKQYKWMDNYPNEGNNYYRLKQIDRDGTAELSQVIIVQFKIGKTQPKLTVFPNPVKEELTYRLAHVEAIQQVFLTDIYGKTLLTTTQINGRLSLVGLENGIYVLTAQTTEGSVRSIITKH